MRRTGRIGGVLLLLTLGFAGSAEASISLVGKVGPGSRLALRSSNGQAVTRLRIGTYRIVVSDGSRAQNFHLMGPNTNKTTGVAFVGRVIWTVKLVPGLYHYSSDRARQNGGSFRVV
jgi:hypothetical protein